jgi:hypothetical protein
MRHPTQEYVDMGNTSSWLWLSVDEHGGRISYHDCDGRIELAEWLKGLIKGRVYNPAFGDTPAELWEFRDCPRCGTTRIRYLSVTEAMEAA